MTGWGKVKAAAAYAGVSERTIRRYLKIGLEYSRMPGGTILISKKAIDGFIRQFTTEENEAEKIVNEVLGAA
ncbi:MAG: helix-turn-helix domain-containing protein [Pseudomonadota bacterium]